MTPQAANALQRRVADAILEGAAKAFMARGVDASMDDIATAAGVARATVYRYFPNRETLFAELNSATVRQICERLVAARLDRVPIDEAVARTVRSLLEAGDPFVVLARQSTRGDDFELKLRSPLVSRLEQARSDGELRGDLPATLLADSLLALVVSVVLSAEREGREDTVAAISRLFLDGARRRGPVAA